MKYLNMGLDKAYDYVKKRRPEISPNIGFMGQLIEYGKKLHGKDLKAGIYITKERSYNLTKYCFLVAKQYILQ